jgi:hypothetical protein
MDRKSKKEYMQDKTFSELMEAAEQALAYERGALDDYRVVRVESAKSPLKVSADEVVLPKSNLSSRRKRKNAADR